jgi:calcineurin-like phosphoesterase family protein
MIWFSADYHFDHSKIIGYCNRPFKNVLQMNEAIIKRHNQVVNKTDTVFVIGDFGFCNTKRREELLNQMNGHFVLLEGNHDRNNSKCSVISKLFLDYGKQKIELVHNPEDVSEFSDLFFVGHVHEKWKIQRHPIHYSRFIINVGVDQWNFTPVNLKSIQKLVKAQ